MQYTKNSIIENSSYNNGYWNEKLYAFFPLLSFILRSDFVFLGYAITLTSIGILWMRKYKTESITIFIYTLWSFMSMVMFIYCISKRLDIKIIVYIIHTPLVNTLLLYDLSWHIFKNSRFATYCGLFYCLNLCTRFNMSLYTENIAMFLTILGLKVLYYEYDVSWDNDGTVRSRFKLRYILTSSLILWISVTWRSNWFLLCIIPGWFILYNLFEVVVDIYENLKKNVSYMHLLSKILEILTWFITGVIVLSSFILILVYLTTISPYYSHWYDSSKLPLPAWCGGSVYNYVQDHYWNSGFLKQLNRGIHESYFQSLPVNLFTLWIILHKSEELLEIFREFFSLKVYKNKTNVSKSVENSSETKILTQWTSETVKRLKSPNSDKSLNKESTKDMQKSIKNINLFKPELLPILIHYIIQVLIIDLFANLEILTRIVSCHPFYYWAFIYFWMIKSTNKWTKYLKRLMFVHHTWLMVFEFIWFPMNVGTP